jgi:hypothetical protein
LLKNLAIDGKEVGKSSIDIQGAKSEQKKVREPKIKKDLPLSKIEIKPICSIGLPKWQEKKLQKLSVEKLKENGLVWVLKEVFKLRRMILKQVVQQRQSREGDSRNNCQVGGLHQIIKIIAHSIIRILYLCLYGIHPLVCMIILILGVDLYVMEGCQIISLTNDLEPKYFVLAMHMHMDKFIWSIF